MFDSKSENRDRAIEAVESVPEIRVRVRVRVRGSSLALLHFLPGSACLPVSAFASPPQLLGLL